MAWQAVGLGRQPLLRGGERCPLALRLRPLVRPTGTSRGAASARCRRSPAARRSSPPRTCGRPGRRPRERLRAPRPPDRPRSAAPSGAGSSTHSALTPARLNAVRSRPSRARATPGRPRRRARPGRHASRACATPRPSAPARSPRRRARAGGRASARADHAGAAGDRTRAYPGHGRSRRRTDQVVDPGPGGVIAPRSAIAHWSRYRPPSDDHVRAQDRERDRHELDGGLPLAEHRGLEHPAAAERPRRAGRGSRTPARRSPARSTARRGAPDTSAISAVETSSLSAVVSRNAPEPGRDPPAAGQAAVEPVGRGSDDEQRSRPPVYEPPSTSAITTGAEHDPQAGAGGEHPR